MPNNKNIVSINADSSHVVSELNYIIDKALEISPNITTPFDKERLIIDGKMLFGEIGSIDRGTFIVVSMFILHEANYPDLYNEEDYTTSKYFKVGESIDVIVSHRAATYTIESMTDHDHEPVYRTIVLRRVHD